MCPNSAQRPVLPSIESLYTPPTTNAPVTTDALDNVPFRSIKFVHNDGQPHAKRRRISVACNTCRRRKTRCTGEQPVCDTCKKCGQECLGYMETQTPSNGVSRRARRGERKLNDDQFPNVGDEQYPGHLSETTHSFGSQTPQLGVLPSHLKLRGISPCSSESLVSDDDINEEQEEEDVFGHRMTGDCDSYGLTYESPIAAPRANRMPYFRYFGPTAIVPGYKQMVVEVGDPRPTSSQSFAPNSAVTSPVSPHDTTTSTAISQSAAATEECLPLYEPQDSGRIHPLIIHLVDIFFIYLGGNFPFLRKEHFVHAVEDGRADTLLVDAVCAVSSRFSTHSLLRKYPPSSRGVHFSNRAKTHVVDTFACPNLSAVQACLLLAYSEFGSNRDSGLWMFLGCAIRMAQDLGLHKLAGMRGEQKGRTEERKRAGSRSFSPDDISIGFIHIKREDDDSEQRTDEQDPTEAAEQRERTDTFWAVYFLDRVTSSGTGRPVTLKDSEIEIAMPSLEEGVNGNAYPQPLPALIRVVHLYGKATDILNNSTNKNSGGASTDTLDALTVMAVDLDGMFQQLSPKLRFTIPNLQHYVEAHQSSVFLLLHFWFHALVVLLHRPTLLIEGRTPQLFTYSYELSMSSAKTIADIFQFSEAMGLDIKAAGNPFTSQPIYIAACAFLQESSRDPSIQRYPQYQMPAIAALSLGSPSRSLSSIEKRQETDQSPDGVPGSRKSTHSFFGFSSQLDYQHCYKALKDIEPYWQGVKYILTVMDQKAKGIVEPLLYTDEEMESVEVHAWPPKVLDLFKRTQEPSADPVESGRRGAGGCDEQAMQGGFPGEAIGVSMTGLTDSKTSVLNFLYQPPGSPASYTAPTLIHQNHQTHHYQQQEQEQQQQQEQEQQQQQQQEQQQHQQMPPPRSFLGDDVLLEFSSPSAPNYQHLGADGFGDVYGVTSEVDVAAILEKLYPLGYIPEDGPS